MKDDETFTEAELRESMARIRFVASTLLSEQIVADIIAHREPEYEVGEIYQDAKDRRFLRVRNPEWPWCLVGFRRGDDESVRGNFASTHVEDFPERPLRKLVPVHEKGSYDDGFLRGFTAGQEASDA